MAKHQLSQATYERLKAEYADLTTRGRIEVADKIERARELGDLKENGDYHAAKDEQGHMEGRIRQIESFLEDVEIVPPSPEGVVGLGTIVAIVYEDHISVMSPSSPLGSALLGATVGATVSYDAPNGKLQVTVLLTRTQG
jgi:transcription elongation factor GreA